MVRRILEERCDARENLTVFIMSSLYGALASWWKKPPTTPEEAIFFSAAFSASACESAGSGNELSNRY